MLHFCTLYLKQQNISKSFKLFIGGLSCITRQKSYYITTPIFYVNSVPHIGHLYTVTLADAMCRWQNLKRGNVENKAARLVCGTDEHGMKVAQAAHENRLDPKVYCDKVSQSFKDMSSCFDVNCYDFVRTTEDRHKAAVQKFWKTIHDNGYIYKGTYEGWYCMSDEAFLSESEVTAIHDERTGEDYHISTISKNRVEWTKEANYMFKLSELQEKLRAWILDNPEVIYPESAKNFVLTMLGKPLNDLSISRERKRVSWGIEVPNDPSQTVYVWMDALVNYLTAAGYSNVGSNTFSNMWPADLHLVGIDIIKFHAIYWPAFLIAAGLALPKRIIVHSHWTVDNVKMSKSIGNVVDPFEISEKVTTNGFRYFLLRQGVLEHNCNYSEMLLYKSVNDDLANDLGNCLHRATAKHLNPTQTYPSFHKQVFPDQPSEKQYRASSEDYNFVELVRRLPTVADEHVSNLHFYNSIHEIMNVVREANMIIQRHAIWTLDKSDPEQLMFLNSMLHCVYEGLRVSGILLQPVIPELADRILSQLNIPEANRTWSDAAASFLEFDGEKEPLIGTALVKGPILFKRLNPS